VALWRCSRLAPRPPGLDASLHGGMGKHRHRPDVQYASTIGEFPDGSLDHVRGVPVAFDIVGRPHEPVLTYLFVWLFAPGLLDAVGVHVESVPDANLAGLNIDVAPRLLAGRNPLLKSASVILSRVQGISAISSSGIITGSSHVTTVLCH